MPVVSHFADYRCGHDDRVWNGFAGFLQFFGEAQMERQAISPENLRSIVTG
jgi:hypothetical protein